MGEVGFIRSETFCFQGLVNKWFHSEDLAAVEPRITDRIPIFFSNISCTTHPFFFAKSFLHVFFYF